MREHLRKWLTVVLSLLLAITPVLPEVAKAAATPDSPALAPATELAEQTPTEIVSEQPTQAPLAPASTQATILQEDKTKRDEYTKEYLMSDGSRMLVVYPDQVHYEKEGEWREIDNTLVPDATRSGELKNKEGDWNIYLPLDFDPEESKVTVEKGEYTLSFGMGVEAAAVQQPAPEAPPEEQVEEPAAEPPAAEPSIEEEPETQPPAQELGTQPEIAPEEPLAEGETAQVGEDPDPAQPSAEEPTGQDTAQLQTEDPLPEEEPETEEPVIEEPAAEQPETEEPAAEEPAPEVIPQPLPGEAEEEADQEEPLLEETSVRKLSGRKVTGSGISFVQARSLMDARQQQVMPANLNAGRVYQNIYDNISLEYRLAGQRLKENIILHTKPSEEMIFRFFAEGENGRETFYVPGQRFLV